MRFSIVVPDEVIETVRERAAAAGISQTEWARRLVLAGCDGRTPPDAPSEVRRLEDEIADAGARIASLTAAIAAAEAEAVRLRDEATAARLELETATADRDALAVRVAVLEAEAKKDAEHIRSLQSAIATVAAGARPALETAADVDQGRPGILDGIRAWLRR